MTSAVPPETVSLQPSSSPDELRTQTSWVVDEGLLKCRSTFPGFAFNVDSWNARLPSEAAATSTVSPLEPLEEDVDVPEEAVVVLVLPLLLPPQAASARATTASSASKTVDRLVMASSHSWVSDWDGDLTLPLPPRARLRSRR